MTKKKYTIQCTVPVHYDVHIEAESKEEAEKLFRATEGDYSIFDNYEDHGEIEISDILEEPVKTIEKDAGDHIYEITYTFQRAFTVNIRAYSAEEVQLLFEQNDEYKYRYTMAEEGKGTQNQLMAIVEIQPEDEYKEYLERSSRAFYNYKTGEAYEGFEKKQPVKYTSDPNPLSIKTYSIDYYYVIVSYVDIKAKNMEEAKKLFSETYAWDPGFEIDESPNFISGIIQIKEEE